MDSGNVKKKLIDPLFGATNAGKLGNFGSASYASDNPAGQLLDKLTQSKGALVKGTGKYIDFLTSMREAKGLVPATSTEALIESQDPFAVLKRINKFKVFEGEEGFRAVGSKLEKVMDMGQIDLGRGAFNRFTSISQMFGEIGRSSPGAKIYKKGEEIYIATEQGRFIPLPFQRKAARLESGVVTIGRRVRSARSVTVETQAGDTIQRTYAEAFYRKMAQARDAVGLDSKFLDRVAKLHHETIGYSLAGKVKLNALLGTGPLVNGIKKSTFTAFMAGSESLLVAGENIVGLGAEQISKQFGPESFKMFQAQASASTALRNLHLGLMSRAKAPFESALGEAITGTAFMDTQYSTLARVFKQFPELYSKMGLEGMFHLTTSDFVANIEKGIVLPTQKGIVAMGATIMKRSIGGVDYYDPTAQKKGGKQYKKPASLSRAEKIIARKAGARLAPSFMTDMAYDLFDKGKLNEVRTKRVAIVDFKSPMHEQLIFQESGSIVTPLGLSRNRIQANLGKITISSPGRRALVGFEQLTGVDVFSEVPVAVQINQLDFTRATERVRGKFAIPTSQLSAKQKGLRKLVTASRKNIGIFEQLADRTLPGAEKGSVMMIPRLSGGKLTINLATPETAPNALASITGVLGRRRFTGIAPDKGHVLATDVAALAKNLGVEEVISRTEYMNILKMNRREPFLTQFGSVMTRHPELFQKYRNMMPDAVGIEKIQGAKSLIVRGIDYEGGVSKQFQLQALRVIRAMRKEGGAEKNLANIILRGLKVKASPGSALSQYAKGDIEIRDLLGFARSDINQDTNIMKAARMTMGKLKTVAIGAASLGYKSALDDPFFSQLHKAMSSKLMTKWDPKKMDFVLDESHPLQKFIKAIADPSSVIPKASDVISVKENKLFLGDVELKDLPNLNKFKKSQGGATLEELKGTILAPTGRGTKMDPTDSKGFYYLDLGEAKDLGLLGVDKNKVAILGGTKHRYIPIPKALMRAKATADGVTIGKTHPAYNIIRAFSIMQGSPESMLTGTSGRLETTSGKIITGFDTKRHATAALKEGIRDIFDSISGKTGLLSRMTQLSMKAGYGARLIPQQSTLITPENFGDIDKLFEGAMSRKQVISAIRSRKGMMSADLYDDLLHRAKTEQYLHAAVIADPTQRLEHTFLQRIRLVDTELMEGAKGEAVDQLKLNMQMHPFLFKMVERDTDADRIVTMFLKGNVREFEDRIARQSKAVSPMFQFFTSEMRKAKAASSAVKMELIQDVFSSWAGQKMYSALGYSIVRPTVERFLPTIYNEGAEGLIRMGVEVGAPGRITRSQIETIRSLVPSAQEFSAANMVGQYILQGGVDKGISKYGLQELSQGLVSLADKTKQAGLNIDEALKDSYNMFYKFLSGSKSNRIFAAGDLLENRSTPKVLQGLIEGASKSAEEIRIGKAAALLASTVGIGYAVAPLTPNIYTLGALAETSTTAADMDVGSIFKRIINPILGVVTKKQTAGEGEFIGPPPPEGMPGVPAKPKKTFTSRMTELKEEILGDMSKLKSSKYLKPTVYGVAALAGIGLYNRLTAPDLSGKQMSDQTLPPPVDTSMPMDMGPQVMPRMNSLPRINSSSFTPSAGRNRINQNFGSVKTNFFENRSNSRVIIDDRSSSRQNSWLLRRQMDMESESDFAY